MAELLTRSVAALQAGDAVGALRWVDAVLAEQPRLAVAHLVRGRSLLENGDGRGALAAIHEAVRLGPESAEAHATLGAALSTSGLLEEARAAFARALELDAKSASIQVRAAALEVERGELDAAQRLYELAQRAGHPAALAGLIVVHERRGDLRAAGDLLAREGALHAPSLELRLAAARVLRRLGRAGEARGLLESIEVARLTLAQRVLVLHALGDTLDECGEPQLAFVAWRRANDARGTTFDGGALVERVDDLCRRFTRSEFATLPRASNRDERPVFVIGAPRSGTSLVEQILAAHGQVIGAGELDDVPNLARGLDVHSHAALDTASNRYLARITSLGAGARRITDKLPHNAFHLGDIALMFPAARVIHVRRDPVDTGLSIYSRNFHAAHDYATDLGAIGVFLREYRRVMDHWREHLPLAIHELDYEALVAEPERSARELLAFVGLEWEDSVLRFHESRRVVHTASYAQVRRPMYSNSIGRAARFDAELAPLRASLAAIVSASSRELAPRKLRADVA